MNNKLKAFGSSLKYLFMTQKQKQALANQLKIEAALLKLKLVAPLTEEDIQYILFHAKRIASVSTYWDIFDVLWVVEGSLLYDGNIERVKRLLNEGWR